MTKFTIFSTYKTLHMALVAYFLNVTQTKKQPGTGFTSLITLTYQKSKKKIIIKIEKQCDRLYPSIKKVPVIHVRNIFLCNKAEVLNV